MKSSPSTAFIVTEAEFLFQFLVVAFNDPSMLGQIDQTFERKVFGKQESRIRF